MSKHTRGPWIVSKTGQDLPGVDIVSIRAPGLALIGEVYAQRYDNETWSALPNAQLIAASPELADALERLLDSLANIETTNNSQGHLKDLGNAEHEARAILKKVGRL